MVVGGRCGFKLVALLFLTLAAELSFAASSALSNDPAIGLAKRAGEVVVNRDGTCRVEFQLKVQNPGNERLVSVQVVDRLAQQLAPATIVGIDRLTALPTLGEVNTNFDGDAEPLLLSGSGSLAPGESATIDFRLTFRPAANPPADNTYYNQAQARAYSEPSNVQVNDLSQAGFDADPDTPGIIAIENPHPERHADKTPLVCGQRAAIGVAKQVLNIQPVNDAPNRFRLTIRSVLENLGESTLHDVMAEEDLALTLAQAEGFQVVSPVEVLAGAIAVNPNFDGVNQTNLLGAGATLEVGQTVTLEFGLEVEVGTFFGPYSNQILAVADADGVPVADLSNDGVDPDPNGNGIADEPGENSPSVFEFPRPQASGRLGIAKRLSAIEALGEDRYRADFTLIVSNLSNTMTLPRIQVEDDLAITLVDARDIQVSGPVQVSGDLAEANTNFDGRLDTALLSGGETLQPGASATLNFGVFFTTSQRETRFNSAIATSRDDAGEIVARDLSDDGSEPDPNGNGRADDPGEDDPTPIDLPNLHGGQIGVAKTVTDISSTAPGVYQLTVRSVVENLSSIALNDVVLEENLAATFADADSFRVGAIQIIAGELTPNSSFDGTSDTNLLNPDSELAPFARAELEFQVELEASFLGPYSNQIVAHATGNGQPVTDLSDNGEQTDPNGNGIANEPGENDPTLFSLPPSPTSEPSIGLAKELTSIVDLGSNRYRAEFILRVANLRPDVPLPRVQVTDNLATTFAAASDISVVSAPQISGALTAINPEFDGLSDTDLLSGEQTLGPGETAALTLAVEFSAAPGSTHLNSAVASSRDPEGDLLTQDLSDDGTDPDSNGNGRGDDADEDDPTPITTPMGPAAAGVVGIAKQLVSSSLSADGTLQASFALVIQNLGTAVLSDVQVIEDLAAAFPAPATASLVDRPEVTGALSALDPSFDGGAVTTMLAGTESLNPGDEARIRFTVAVALNGAQGPFSNQAIARGTNPDDSISEDLSDDGVTPDTNGDGDPTGPGEDDPTPIDVPATLVGTVFEDLNFNNRLDTTDTPLSGWVVEVLDAQGNVVASAVTGTDGTYSFGELSPGDYTVQFRHPQNNVVWARNDATLVENQVTRVDLPVVPGGRVYDSATREPLSGTTLALHDAMGTPVADACLLPGQQNQIVPEDGSYRFDVVPGAHASCPTVSANYQIQIVEVTDGYRNMPSVVIPPAAGALDAAVCAIDPNSEPPCVVQQQSQPPAVGEDTTYFLQWELDGDHRAIANNHIPLDQEFEGGVLNLVTISKQVSDETAVIGDVLGYEILVSNTTAAPLAGIELLDNIPAGFQFVEGSQSLREPGADGLLDTLDDVVQPLISNGVDPVTLGPINIAAQTTIAVRYLVRVGTGVTQGEYINTATPVLGGTVVGNVASAAVEVISDPLFEKTTIIGKVFNDANKNGWQDEDEDGVPGVRLATVGGLLIETDRHGRYHIADVDVPRAERGANFILKLDTASLPPESEVISENPRVIRITQALMSKINFAVNVPEHKIPAQPTRFAKTQRVTHYLDNLIEPVRFASGKSEIPQSYTARLAQLLKSHEGRTNLRLRFVGHTDNEPLSPRAQKIYGDNLGLSRARAESVARFVQTELGIATDAVEMSGMGDTQPVASNASRAGMRLNRRVEISVVYDDMVATEETVEEVTTLGQDSNEVVFDNQTAQLEPVHFNSGALKLSADEQRVLDQRLQQFADREVIALTVIGHADNAPVAANARYSDNQALSRLRAQAVADHVAQALKIPAGKISVEARGAANAAPYEAENNKEAVDRQLQQRRVEIAVTYRKKTAAIVTTYKPIHAEPMRAAGGRFWITDDALATQPRMDVLALTQIVADADGRMLDPVDFVAVSNYGQFIDRYQLEIYRASDTDLLRPIATLEENRLAYPRAFKWQDESIALRPGERFAYVLRALRGNTADTTHARLVRCRQ